MRRERECVFIVWSCFSSPFLSAFEVPHFPHAQQQIHLKATKKDETRVLLSLLSREEEERILPSRRSVIGCCSRVDFEALLFFSSTKIYEAEWSFRRRRRRRRRRSSSVFGTTVVVRVVVDDDSKRRDRVRSRLFLFFFVFFESVRRQSATLRAREPEREKIRE
jgi:hypothetical protein